MKKKKAKKIIFVVIGLLIIVIATFCNILAPKVTTIENVSITIKQKTLNREGAIFIVTNKSKKECSFGEEYNIERKVFGKWIKVKEKNSDIW